MGQPLSKQLYVLEKAAKSFSVDASVLVLVGAGWIGLIVNVFQALLCKHFQKRLVLWKNLGNGHKDVAGSEQQQLLRVSWGICFFFVMLLLF